MARSRLRALTVALDSRRRAVGSQALRPVKTAQAAREASGTTAPLTFLMQRAMILDMPTVFFIAGLIVAEYPEAGRARAATYAQVVIGACERLATAPHGTNVLSPVALPYATVRVIPMTTSVGFGSSLTKSR